MLICGCGFLLFLLPYIQPLQAGQDLIIMHTKLKGRDACPCHIFAIHHEQQREGKAGRKSGLAGQDATLAGGNSRERKSEKTVLV